MLTTDIRIMFWFTVDVIVAFPNRIHEESRQNVNSWITGQDGPQWFQRHDRDLLSALADRWEANGIHGIHDMTESKRSAEAAKQKLMMVFVPKNENEDTQ